MKLTVRLARTTHNPYALVISTAAHNAVEPHASCITHEPQVPDSLGLVPFGVLVDPGQR